jgi:membrane protease YdiL (CAAX protease family)
VIEKHSGRLLAWLIFVGALALIAYAGRLYGPEEPENLAYKYSSSVAAIIQYAFILGIVVIYIGSFAYEQALSLFGDWSTSDEQGLVPSGWDSSRAGAFIAFFLVVTILAPAIEELTYRGLGISLIEPWGVTLAVLTTGILFGAAHGLVLGFPILAFFGVVVGTLRVKTGSVYPGMLLHATFNAIALIVSVAA